MILQCGVYLSREFVKIVLIKKPYFEVPHSVAFNKVVVCNIAKYVLYKNPIFRIKNFNAKYGFH